jgi:hypothetical protein
LQAQTFQTPALAAFDIEVDANSCFPELLLAVATVDVACRYGTLATGAGKGVYIQEHFQIEVLSARHPVPNFAKLSTISCAGTGGDNLA